MIPNALELTHSVKEGLKKLSAQWACEGLNRSGVWGLSQIKITANQRETVSNKLIVEICKSSYSSTPMGTISSLTKDLKF